MTELLLLLSLLLLLLLFWLLLLLLLLPKLGWGGYCNEYFQERDPRLVKQSNKELKHR